jgi:hypothetical protein
MTVTMSAPMPVAVRAQARAMGQRESTAVKSHEAAKEAPAPNMNALKNKRWRQRKKLNMQQVKEELAIAELEREQLKNEQTLLREKMKTSVLTLLSNHQHHILGWSHVPPMTSQSFFAQAAASASSTYGTGPLPRRVRNTPPLAELQSARAEGCGVSNFCAAGLQQQERSMLRYAYQQQRKEEYQQNMSYAASIVAQERIKNIANYQQYGDGTHPEYSAAAAGQALKGSDLYTRQGMAQQQQLTTSTIMTSPPLIATPKKKAMSASAKKISTEQDDSATSCNTIKMLQPPRRPLSAYNFFFQDERAKLLGSQIIEDEHDDPRERKKRRHRKAHGKIGFTQLAKHVGQLWKTLDAETRKSYDMKFQQAKKRYAAELEEYEEQLFNMLHLAQVKKATEHRIAVEEAKLLELRETYRNRKAALEEEHSK